MLIGLFLFIGALFFSESPPSHVGDWGRKEMSRETSNLGNARLKSELSSRAARRRLGFLEEDFLSANLPLFCTAKCSTTVGAAEISIILCPRI